MPLCRCLLRCHESRIGATWQCHQLVMVPLLEDHAPEHHADGVRVADGGQAVRDGQRGAPRSHHVQCGLHCALAARVQRRGGLIQQQHLGVLDDRARDGDALLLAAAELDAALPHARVHPLRQLGDEVGRVGRARRRLHLLQAGTRRAVRDVVRDGARKQQRLLRHQPHLLPHPLEVVTGQRAAIQQDVARLRVVEALQQRHHGGLAAAALAHQRARLARLDVQAEVAVDDHGGARGVRKAHAPELDLAAHRLRRRRLTLRAAGVNGGHAVDQREHAPHSRLGLADVREGGPDLCHAHGSKEHRQE
mmetsp:Transcript_13766/g.33854  ORF Transcript_13766/g.33854 Transcript_13766/m.33854 type:complete len:306 (-) Transcript_13766:3780-4697(-)